MTKECNQCKEVKQIELFGRNKYTKDGFKNKCKECERKNREIKKGRKTKKNINNLIDANDWLQENYPKYKVIKWGGKKKSTIKNTERNIEFEYIFYRFKAKLKEYPNRIFGATKEEKTEKIKKVFKERYGVEHALQVDKFKEKAQRTNLERYGNKNAMKVEELRRKQIKSLNQNYGVSNPMKLQEIKEKAYQTNLEKYGTKHPNQNKEIQKKIKKTNLERYGFKAPALNEKVQEKAKNTKIKNGSLKLYDGKTLKESATETEFSYSYFQQLVKRYGYDYAINAEKKRNHLEERVLEIIINNNPIRDKFLTKENKYKPDFQLKEEKLIIECDGLFWHCDKIIEDNNYHFKKKKYYEDFGYDSLFFREDEIRDKFPIIKSIINNKLKKSSKKIFARNCKVLPIKRKQGREFLRENHLMGNGQGRYLGLHYKNELVCTIQVRWKNKEEKLLDIARFCPKLNHSIVGGWSKLISEVIKQESPNKIQTFIDKRYGSGKYLEKLGWKFETNYPSFKWTDGKDSWHRSRFSFNSGYEYGLAKIWDCGQTKYILA